MRPIAFMIMPFGWKVNQTVGGGGGPTRIDFDALWHKVHQPVLDSLGYNPVRADCDLGALVIVEMIQRLAIADVVVADVSMSNSNVYYEIGVRHAAKSNGCVLVAADWARPVFDLEQIRRIGYPLADGECGDPAAAAAKELLLAQLPGFLDGGNSPVFDALPGYPGPVEVARLRAFSSLVEELSRFEADVREIRLTASSTGRQRLTSDLVARHGSLRVVRESVVVELIGLIRDNLGWAETLDYIESLPTLLKRHPTVAEQRELALAKTGNVARAAAALEQLIARSGATPERLGLLGGRYKDLMRNAPTNASKRQFLGKAITAYEHGMALDLNNYYPAANLPRLYRLRADSGDEQLAVETATVAAAACKASMVRDPEDRWAVLTLLGVAFDTGDVVAARNLVRQIEQDDVATWRLESTVRDLADSVSVQRSAAVQAGLTELMVEINAILDG